MSYYGPLALPIIVPTRTGGITRMKTVKMVDGLNPTRFEVGGRALVIGRDPVQISEDDFATITSQLPGWIQLVDALPAPDPSGSVASTAALKAAAAGNSRLIVCTNDDEFGLPTVSLWTGSQLLTFATLKRDL